MQEEKAERFVMPEVHLTDTVLWHPEASPELEPRPAIVVHVGHDTVALALLEKDAFGVTPLDGVRYKSDPALNKPESRSSGSWSYSPTTLRLFKVEAILADLLGTAPKPKLS